MKEKGLKLNLILSTAYQILNLIIPLITAPYVSRVLGVDGIGIYSYTHAYSMYFSLFAALGTVSYGTREIAQHRNNRSEYSKLFWEIAIMTIITSTICILGWGAWILFNDSYKIYYMILTVSLLGTMFDISWFYAGLEEFKYTVSQNSIFKIIGTIAIFVCVNSHSDLWKYILILSLTVFLANISMWIYLPKMIVMVPIESLSIRRHFRETFVYFVPTIATSVYTILDKTLIGLITNNTSENGNYEQATKIINMAKTLSFTGVNMVLQSRISYLFSDKKIEEIKRRIAVSMDYILFIGFALCFGIMGVSDRFVPLFFGPGYEKTIILLQGMAPLIIIIGISNCLGSQYYNPAGLRAKSAKYIIAGSIINLIMNLLLIPLFGSIGAVIATLCAELSITTLYLRNCDSFYKLSSLTKQSYKKAFSGLIMLLVVLSLGRLSFNDVSIIIIQVLVGGTVYLLLLFLMRDSFIYDFVYNRIHKIQ